jgi:hypothetical protein
MLFVFQKAKMTRARMISQPMSMTTKTRIFRSIQIEHYCHLDIQCGMQEKNNQVAV